MIMLSTPTVLLFLLLSMLTPGLPADSRTYNLTELDTPAEGNCVGRGLNNRGHVVGRVGSFIGTDTRAFIWKGGRNLLHVASPNGGEYSWASGINDQVDIVGALNSGDSIQAFIAKQAEEIRILPNLPGNNSSQAISINKSGEIAGYSGIQACLWTRTGEVQDLGILPGGETSKASDINDSGDVVGLSTSSNGPRAFLWTRQEGMVDLGTLPGDTASEALAINNSADVVGFSSGLKGQRAFLWTRKNGMQDLGFLPGGNHSRALDISNSGAVIGTSASASGLRAFLWTKQAGMKDLNLLIPYNSGLFLIEAHAINDRGQVVVFGSDSYDGDNHEGSNRLFLLTPGTVGVE